MKNSCYILLCVTDLVNEMDLLSNEKVALLFYQIVGIFKRNVCYSEVRLSLYFRIILMN